MSLRALLRAGSLLGCVLLGMALGTGPLLAAVVTTIGGGGGVTGLTANDCATVNRVLAMHGSTPNTAKCATITDDGSVLTVGSATVPVNIGGSTAASTTYRLALLLPTGGALRIDGPNSAGGTQDIQFGYTAGFAGAIRSTTKSGGGGALTFSASPSGTTHVLGLTLGDDSTVTLGSAGVAGVNYISGTGDHTFSDGRVIVERLNAVVQAETCTDNGTPAVAQALTITPTSNVITITNADGDGCNITVSETGAVAGTVITFVVISNAGGAVNFADSAGVTELAGAFAAGLEDTITLVYAGTAFREVARSNN